MKLSQRGQHPRAADLCMLLVETLKKADDGNGGGLLWLLWRLVLVVVAFGCGCRGVLFWRCSWGLLVESASSLKASPCVTWISAHVVTLQETETVNILPIK